MIEPHVELNTGNVLASLYSHKLNNSVSRASGLWSKGCWFNPTKNVRCATIFSSDNVRLLAYTSLQLKTNNQNEWFVENLIEYTWTWLRPGLYSSVSLWMVYVRTLNLAGDHTGRSFEYHCGQLFSFCNFRLFRVPRSSTFQIQMKSSTTFIRGNTVGAYREREKLDICLMTA